MKQDTLEVIFQKPPVAGSAGDFALKITVGERSIAPEGGFLIYPPITTMPHAWSMVRWHLGGCLLRMPDDHEADAWMVSADRLGYAESCAVLVRIVDGRKSMPPGYTFDLILSNCKVQTFAMSNSWFAMEVDNEGVGYQAYSAPLESVPISAMEWPVVFDFEANESGVAYFDVLPAPATCLKALLEAKPRADGTVYLEVRAEDEFGNCAHLPEDSLKLISSDAAFVVPEEVACDRDKPLAVRIDSCKAASPGTYFVEVRAPRSGLSCESSFTSTELPMPIYFGDLHGHSSLSDGLGSGDEYFLHARNRSFCDFVCLSDHEPFDEMIIDLTEKHNEPGRMVTIFGRERGTGTGGDRNLYSTRAEAIRSFATGDVWEYCKECGKDVILVPHHTNASTKRHWKEANFERHDPEHERLIEVVQNRGSFETDEIGGPVLDGGYGASVRDALAMGRRFGFVGGSDSHRGTPGGPSHPLHPYFYNWRDFTGITAAMMRRLTREDLFKSLWSRLTYATTGARILMNFTINGFPMGSELDACDSVDIRVFVAGNDKLAGVDIVCDGEECYTLPGSGDRIARFTYTDTEPGKYYYVRARQCDEHCAYSSPIWIGK